MLREQSCNVRRETCSSNGISCVSAVAEAMCELVLKQCPEAVEVVKQLPQGEPLSLV